MFALAKRSIHSSVINLNRNLIEVESDQSIKKPNLDNKDNAILYSKTSKTLYSFNSPINKDKEIQKDFK
jgi:hypothetical protein